MAKQSKSAQPQRRNTKQGDALREVFEHIERPLSPAELHSLVKKKLPSVGIATIYRALKTLVDEQWLVPVLLPGEPDRYERAGKHHHHHFCCNDCKRVYEVEGCLGSVSKIVPQGFTLESHEITLYGICSGCNRGSQT